MRALRLERGDFELSQFMRDGQQYELRIEVGGAASSVRARIVIRTESATEIPLRFPSFHRPFLT
eukprot:COSAG04_NODE_18140_length_450_cov_0.515670_1_plen_64_part_00